MSAEAIRSVQRKLGDQETLKVYSEENNYDGLFPLFRNVETDNYYPMDLVDRQPELLRKGEIETLSPEDLKKKYPNGYTVQKNAFTDSYYISGHFISTDNSKRFDKDKLEEYAVLALQGESPELYGVYNPDVLLDRDIVYHQTEGRFIYDPKRARKRRKYISFKGQIYNRQGAITADGIHKVCNKIMEAMKLDWQKEQYPIFKYLVVKKSTGAKQLRALLLLAKRMKLRGFKRNPIWKEFVKGIDKAVLVEERRESKSNHYYGAGAQVLKEIKELIK